MENQTSVKVTPKAFHGHKPLEKLQVLFERRIQAEAILQCLRRRSFSFAPFPCSTIVPADSPLSKTFKFKLKGFCPDSSLQIAPFVKSQHECSVSQRLKHRHSAPTQTLCSSILLQGCVLLLQSTLGPLVTHTCSSFKTDWDYAHSIQPLKLFCAMHI
ncbi:uncharacterized protein LOC143482461 [Brachyhypopomus gauderio]|uniref:uncharacterized protein LOC143482461 n=1 Tax=Brachyhypopomus gauderio TaxID=698409 RepID=UPI00404111A0